MKIYDHPLSPNARKVRAVAYELGLKPEFIVVNVLAGEQRKPEILALNPNGKIPFLVDTGLVLWESNAIVSYLAQGSTLLPTTPRDRADVDRWCYWQATHIGPAIQKVTFQRLIKPMLGLGQADAKVVEEASADYASHAKVLDASLGTKEYVAGRLSIADFVLGAFFTMVAPAGLDTKPYPNVDGWVARILARESVKRALADAQASMPR